MNNYYIETLDIRRPEKFFLYFKFILKMKNVIFFFEPSEILYETPLKIGILYLNRFTIDENAAFEIQSIRLLPPNKSHDEEMLEKGRE